MAGRRRGQIQARGAGAWLIRISLPADSTGKRRTWNKTVHRGRDAAGPADPLRSPGRVRAWPGERRPARLANLYAAEALAPPPADNPDQG